MIGVVIWGVLIGWANLGPTVCDSPANTGTEVSAPVAGSSLPEPPRSRPENRLRSTTTRVAASADVSASTAAAVKAPATDGSRAAASRHVDVTVTCNDRRIEHVRFRCETTDGEAQPDCDWDRLPTGGFRVHVGVPLSAPFTILIDAPTHSVVRRTVGAGVSSVDVRLPPGSLVIGEVRTDRGDVVSGARVVIGGLVTVADDCGVYRLVDVGPGAYTSAMVSKGEWAVTAPCDLRIERAGQTITCNIVLSAEVRARVLVVRASDGVPLPGARVVAWAGESAAPSRARGVSGADGLVELSGLASGEYWIGVWGDEISPALVERWRFPSDRPALVPVRPYVVRQTSGVVREPDGKPVVGAIVSSLYSGAGVTDSDGRFECAVGRVTPKLKATLLMGEDGPWDGGVRPPGPIDDVEVRARDGATRTFRVPAGVPASLVWHRTIRVSGEVRANKGATVPSFWVSQRTDDGFAPSVHVAVGRGATSRRFDLPGFALASGGFALTFEDGRSQDVPIERRGPGRVDLGVIAVSVPAELRVVGVGGEVMSDPVVVAAWRGTALSVERAATTDSKGRVTNLPPGPRRMVAWTRGCLALDLGVVELRSGEQTTAIADFVRPAELSVFVHCGGRVSPGAQVEIRPDAAPPDFDDLRTMTWNGPGDERWAYSGHDLALTTKTDEAGAARITRLCPGRVRVLVAGADPVRRVEVTVDAEAGRVTDVDVNLQESAPEPDQAPR